MILGDFVTYLTNRPYAFAQGSFGAAHSGPSKSLSSRWGSCG